MVVPNSCGRGEEGLLQISVTGTQWSTLASIRSMAVEASLSFRVSLSRLPNGQQEHIIALRGHYRCHGPLQSDTDSRRHAFEVATRSRPMSVWMHRNSLGVAPKLGEPRVIRESLAIAIAKDGPNGHPARIMLRTCGVESLVGSAVKFSSAPSIDVVASKPRSSSWKLKLERTEEGFAMPIEAAVMEPICLTTGCLQPDA
ncbi:uncharacterized protein C8Q71DRAFT_781866 [Rhodofomes roseus]|uniref:Uncharacterized protein n=1 Tax=Rhodofomes roseus TaxID=34475 RepID=A0ABQ8K583_9APHY|nr:uncharacterized protein C8Q71DRAFT_781866 [Rhodofomes roseus]KAH9831657.1 hypothetical protein C8Q71DRAFT_781866 [Rhodofomes roseus]